MSGEYRSEIPTDGAMMLLKKVIDEKGNAVRQDNCYANRQRLGKAGSILEHDDEHGLVNEIETVAV